MQQPSSGVGAAAGGAAPQVIQVPAMIYNHVTPHIIKFSGEDAKRELKQSMLQKK
jgi:hypothetical protein